MPPSSPALARPSPRLGERRLDTLAPIVAVLAGLVIVASLHPILADRPRVELVVDNPTEYDVSVGVRPAAGGPRLGLGTVAAGSESAFRLVIDQGDRWVFDFSYGPVDGPTLELPRERVSDTTVLVPESVADSFRAAGLPTPPP